MTRRTAVLAATWLLGAPWFGACDDDSNGSQPDGAGDADAEAEREAADDEATEAAGDGDGAAEAGPDGIAGRARVDFDLTVDGRGRTLVGATTFARSVGLVRLDRDVRALAYEVTDWAEFGYVLFHVLAPEAGSLHVLYLYCGSESARSLDYVWHEAFGVPMDYEAAFGECWAERAPIVTDVELEALSALPEPESIDSGLVVDGPDAVLDDAGGFVVLGGREYGAHPFGLVDCTSECSADPADGWWEIHTVLRDPDDGEPCFGTLYLMVASADDVALGYGFCLESLTRLPDVGLDAAWRRDGGKGRDAGAIPAGPYDPRVGHVLRPGPRVVFRPRTGRGPRDP